MFLFLLFGCTAQAAAPEANTLQVLTEHSPADGMNYQLEQIAAAFLAEHDDVTVEIEYLPTDAEERSMYFYQLRVEIMAGRGPDIYLFPTEGILYQEISTVYAEGVEAYEVEPLFADINQAVRNGVFQDIILKSNKTI